MVQSLEPLMDSQVGVVLDRYALDGSPREGTQTLKNLLIAELLRQ